MFGMRSIKFPGCVFTHKDKKDITMHFETKDDFIMFTAAQILASTNYLEKHADHAQDNSVKEATRLANKFNAVWNKNAPKSPMVRGQLPLNAGQQIVENALANSDDDVSTAGGTRRQQFTGEAPPGMFVDADGNLRPNDAPDVKVSFKSAGPSVQQGG
jgi:hypothetical protein